MLPNFIGKYFPHNNDPDIYHFYCACMLVLLWPWCNISTNLKEPNESWSDVFVAFKSSASKKILDILSGIQYFHQCESEATQDKDGNDSQVEMDQAATGTQVDNDAVLPEDCQQPCTTLTEEGLAALIQSQVSWRKENHAMQAIQFAKHTRIFSDYDTASWTVHADATLASNISEEQCCLLTVWSKQLHADIVRQNSQVTLGVDVSGGDDMGNHSSVN